MSYFSDTSGLYLGLTAGVVLGLHLVYWWGLRGCRPRINLPVLTVAGVSVAVLMVVSAALGISRTFWVATGLAFPLGLLPFTLFALSAHTYIGQSLTLSAFCLYLAALLGYRGGDLSAAASHLVLAVIFLLLPAFFAALGRLNQVQRWNLLFWEKLRTFLNLPATPPK